MWKKLDKPWVIILVVFIAYGIVGFIDANSVQGW